MDRRVTIYAAGVERSPTGVEKPSWNTIATVWAARERLSLTEVNRMAGKAEAAEARFVVRYRSDVTTANQIECDGQRFCVVGVDEIGRREALALIVRAV
ncbi:phage head closure protein [Sphingomonas aerophila]|nr:phage head closure protein [Sphingomonas aerophila]